MAQVTTQTSNQYSLDWKDGGKGFIVAFITAFLTTAYESISAGTMPTVAQLKAAGLAGLGAGIAYLLKNFFTPSQTVVKTNEVLPYSPNQN